MRMALREAEKAAADGETPTGCVIVEPKILEPAHDGRDPVFDWDPSVATILGRAHNQTEGLADATAHAEMLALSSAFAAKGNWRLVNARLYVTKEPCPMCAGGIVLARPRTVIWGVSDPKRGGGTVFNIFSHPGINHHPEVVAGVLEDGCRSVLQNFFRSRRGGAKRLISKALSLLAAALFSFPLFALTTNDVDIAALAACGTGTTNGWTVCGIDSYSDKTVNIRLNKDGEYVLSPEFPKPIRSLLVTVKSSSVSGRKLAFLPLVDEVYDTAHQAVCDYSPNKDTYVSQKLDFASDLDFTAFKIDFDDGGGNTGWGISSLAVITDTPSAASPPTSLTVKSRASSATLRWLNDGNTVSNLVSLSRILHTPEGGTAVKDYDFEDCVNTGKSESDMSKAFHELYPDFTSEKLYYPTNETGAIRISTGKANGILTHAGFADCTNLTMEVTAKRYAGDDRMENVSVYWIGDGAVTNVLGAIQVSDEFSRSLVSIASVPSDTPIHLSNLDGSKSNRRFLIDRIRILENYAPESTTTNTVAGIMRPASGVFHLRGLSPRSTYQVRISAYDSAGILSDPSEPLVFVTAASDPGVIFRFQ